MKKTVLIFMIIFAALSFSCRLSPEGEDGEFLQTNLLGYFMEDQSYTRYSSTEWNNGVYLDTREIITYTADGDFSIVVHIDEDSMYDVDGDGSYGGYILWMEYEGTYSYNSSLLVLKRSYTERKEYYSSDWDSLSETYEFTYDNNPDSITYGSNTSKLSYYFTDTGYGSAYKPNLGKYTYTYEYRGEDGYHYKYQSSIGYIGNRLTFSSKSWNSEMELPLIFNLSYEYEMVVELDEPLLAFVPGQTVELEGEIASVRTRSYETGVYSAEWEEDPYNSVGNNFVTTLSNYGGFIAY